MIDVKNDNTSFSSWPGGYPAFFVATDISLTSFETKRPQGPTMYLPYNTHAMSRCHESLPCGGRNVIRPSTSREIVDGCEKIHAKLSCIRYDPVTNIITVENSDIIVNSNGTVD